MFSIPDISPRCQGAKKEVLTPGLLEVVVPSEHVFVEVGGLEVPDASGFGSLFGGLKFSAARGLSFGLSGAAEELLHRFGRRVGWWRAPGVQWRA